MKGELSGVGPVFAGVADPIGSGFVASLAPRGGRRCWPRSFVALEPRCDPQSNHAAAMLQADAGRVRPLLMITPGTAASRCIFLLKSLQSWRPCGRVVASPGPS